MSQVVIQWRDVYGMGRHLVIQTPVGPWSPCSMEGKPLGPGLPCTTCTETVWELLGNMTALSAAA